MDTPEKTQIGTPLSKFEDSPVFNYINTLSPIKPVKSIHVTQTFNSLSFASLPSVFTSPHVSSHKESRFLKRHNSSDPSKPELSCEDGNKTDKDADHFDPEASVAEALIETPAELPQVLKYDCGSPDCNTTVPCVTETNGMAESTLLSHSQGDSDNGISTCGGHIKACNDEMKNEVPDWESMISDATELLIFSSPNDSEAFRGLIQKNLDPQTGFNNSAMSRFNQMVTKVQTNNVIGSSEQHEAIHAETGQAGGVNRPNQTESFSNLHRGMRRRCLDFEMLAARRKNLTDASSSNSLLDNQYKSFNPSLESPRCVLPGIGLHLNALAIASKDSTNVNNGSYFSGRLQLSLPSVTPSIQSLDAGQESLTPGSAKGEAELAESSGQHSEDISKAVANFASDELNPSSPKKKKRKSDQAGDNETACKRCNCKKSKCLKLYCECFAAGVYCIEPCSCVDCFNKPIHEDTVLATRKQIESRNPLAFAPKVIRNAEAVTDLGEDSTKTPASARHKRGCNCKKSNCLKKYCECYQGGVGCSINCRCEGCKNAFGRKDGSSLNGPDTEPEEDTETKEKTKKDKASQNPEISTDDELNQNSAIPATPLRLYRPLIQLPFSSTSMPLDPLLAPGSSSGLYNGQKFGKPNILLRAQSKFEKSFEEDEMPEILNHSPNSSLKIGSPNSKRVSPPHCEAGTTPGRSRRLILQSIPAFPSLTPQHGK